MILYSRTTFKVLCITLLGALSSVSVAQENPSAPTTSGPSIETAGVPPATTPAQEEKKDTPSTPVPATQTPAYDQGFFGLDYFVGRSNLPGSRQFSDGFWIGLGPAFPSNAYLRWEAANGATAKVSIGTGELYRRPNATLRQPNEAWYQIPQGQTKITLGKYYVPFAIQDWQYEPKWGAMAQRAFGTSDISASLNIDPMTDKPNLYTRLGHNLSENVNVGASFAFGRGISYGTDQNKMFGLDLTASWRGFQLLSEIVDLRRRSSDRLFFVGNKLTYENLGKWKPFVSRHSWNDRSGNYGSFRSTTLGVDYQLSSTITVEAAYAHTSQQNVRWLQLHWTPEWKYYDEAKEKGRR